MKGRTDRKITRITDLRARDRTNPPPKMLLKTAIKKLCAGSNTG